MASTKSKIGPARAGEDQQEGRSSWSQATSRRCGTWSSRETATPRPSSRWSAWEAAAATRSTPWCESGSQGVEFIAANTDAQALQHNLAPNKVQLGDRDDPRPGLRRRPGEGSRLGPRGARPASTRHFTGTDMVFVTAGLGGGTGTGAAPIVAEVARECGCAHGGRGDQALPLRGQGPHAARRAGPRRAAPGGGHRDHHPESAAARPGRARTRP